MSQQVLKATSETMFAARVWTFLTALSLLATAIACVPPANKDSRPSDTKPNNPVEITSSACGTGAPMELSPDAEELYELVTVFPRTDRFCALVLPIDSQSFESMMMGLKSVDYRRTFPVDRFSHVVFFNTRTLELSVIAEVASSLAGTPEDVSSLTWEKSGSSFEHAVGYFTGRPYGFAIELKTIHRLPKPITLDEAHALDPKFARPYGYLFLDRHPVLNAKIQKQLEL